MPDTFIQSPFAAPPGIDVIIMIVVGLVSVIGWLVNMINENAKRNQGPQVNRGGGGRAADDRFQQEIDDFLQQVGGKPQPRRHQDRVAEEAVDIEVVPERELWEREREERRQRELSSLSNRHVETTVGGAIEEKVREDINVDADLGEAAATGPPRVRRSPQVAPGEIIGMLRDPDGVRKAIIVNEILQRPNRAR